MSRNWQRDFSKGAHADRQRQERIRIQQDHHLNREDAAQVQIQRRIAKVYEAKENVIPTELTPQQRRMESRAGNRALQDANQNIRIIEITKDSLCGRDATVQEKEDYLKDWKSKKPTRKTITKFRNRWVEYLKARGVRSKDFKRMLNRVEKGF